MKTNQSRRRGIASLALVAGLLAAVSVPLAGASRAEAAAGSNVGVIPIFVDGKWFKLQSSWKEQCSSTLRIQTVGGQWPSSDLDDYTIIPRGVNKFVRPADNGGNDGDFYWRCGNSSEYTDAPGNGFNLLGVKHSTTSREIDMMALDVCGNGTSMSGCFQS